MIRFPPRIHHPNSGESSTHILSSWDSHSSALTCSDTLRLIFEKLPVPDLARASCVCRVWNSAASDDETVRSAFIGQWKLKLLMGKPLVRSFWKDNSLEKFAISHAIVEGDNLARIAVKYSAQEMDIKRLNNMTYDTDIYFRRRVLIPIYKPDLLVDGICYIELDFHAKREVAVLYLEGVIRVPDETLNSLSSRVNSGDQGQGWILEQWKGRMHINDGEKQYYLAW